MHCQIWIRTRAVTAIALGKMQNFLSQLLMKCILSEMMPLLLPESYTLVLEMPMTSMSLRRLMFVCSGIFILIISIFMRKLTVVSFFVVLKISGVTREQERQELKASNLPPDLIKTRNTSGNPDSTSMHTENSRYRNVDSNVYHPMPNMPPQRHMHSGHSPTAPYNMNTSMSNSASMSPYEYMRGHSVLGCGPSNPHPYRQDSVMDDSAGHSNAMHNLHAHNASGAHMYYNNGTARHPSPLSHQLPHQLPMRSIPGSADNMGIMNMNRQSSMYSDSNGNNGGGGMYGNALGPNGNSSGSPMYSAPARSSTLSTPHLPSTSPDWSSSYPFPAHAPEPEYSRSSASSYSSRESAPMQSSNNRLVSLNAIDMTRATIFDVAKIMQQEDASTDGEDEDGAIGFTFHQNNSPHAYQHHHHSHSHDITEKMHSAGGNNGNGSAAGFHSGLNTYAGNKRDGMDSGPGAAAQHRRRLEYRQGSTAPNMSPLMPSKMGPSGDASSPLYTTFVPEGPGNHHYNSAKPMASSGGGSGALKDEGSNPHQHSHPPTAHAILAGHRPHLQGNNPRLHAPYSTAANAHGVSSLSNGKAENSPSAATPGPSVSALEIRPPPASAMPSSSPIPPAVPASPTPIAAGNLKVSGSVVDLPAMAGQTDPSRSPVPSQYSPISLSSHAHSHKSSSTNAHASYNGAGSYSSTASSKSPATEPMAHPNAYAHQHPAYRHQSGYPQHPAPSQQQQAHPQPQRRSPYASSTSPILPPTVPNPTPNQGYSRAYTNASSTHSNRHSPELQTPQPPNAASEYVATKPVPQQVLQQPTSEPTPASSLVPVGEPIPQRHRPLDFLSYVATEAASLKVPSGEVDSNMLKQTLALAAAKQLRLSDIENEYLRLFFNAHLFPFPLCNKKHILELIHLWRASSTATDSSSALSQKDKVGLTCFLSGVFAVGALYYGRESESLQYRMAMKPLLDVFSYPSEVMFSALLLHGTFFPNEREGDVSTHLMFSLAKSMKDVVPIQPQLFVTLAFFHTMNSARMGKTIGIPSYFSQSPPYNWKTMSASPMDSAILYEQGYSYLHRMQALDFPDVHSLPQVEKIHHQWITLSEMNPGFDIFPSPDATIATLAYMYLTLRLKIRPTANAVEDFRMKLASATNCAVTSNNYSFRLLLARIFTMLFFQHLENNLTTTHSLHSSCHFATESSDTKPVVGNTSNASDILQASKFRSIRFIAELTNNSNTDPVLQLLFTTALSLLSCAEHKASLICPTFGAILQQSDRLYDPVAYTRIVTNCNYATTSGDVSTPTNLDAEHHNSLCSSLPKSTFATDYNNIALTRGAASTAIEPLRETVLLDCTNALNYLIAYIIHVVPTTISTASIETPPSEQLNPSPLSPESTTETMGLDLSSHSDSNVDKSDGNPSENTFFPGISDSSTAQKPITDNANIATSESTQTVIAHAKDTTMSSEAVSVTSSPAEVADNVKLLSPSDERERFLKIEQLPQVSQSFEHKPILVNHSAHEIRKFLMDWKKCFLPYSFPSNPMEKEVVYRQAMTLFVATQLSYLVYQSL